MMTKINLEGLKLEFRGESDFYRAASIEIIHEDGEDLRINILDRDKFMLTRVEIAVENDTIILKAWLPERWEKNDPDEEFLLSEGRNL